jgi:hypothetical protein
MDTLKYVERNGVAMPTALVTMVTGEPFYVCSDYAELRLAAAQSSVFEVHAVVGMKPVPNVINPAHIVRVEAVRS